MIVAAPMPRRHAERGKPPYPCPTAPARRAVYQEFIAPVAPNGWPIAMAPAIHVDLVVVHVEGLHEAQHDRGERLVHLEEVDIADLHAAVGEDLLRGRHRAGQHDRGIGADLGGRPDAGAGREPVLLARMPCCRSEAPPRHRRSPRNCRRGGYARSAPRCGYFISATASKPGICSPMSLNAGLSAPSACMSVPGRMYSSRSRIVRPFTSATGTTDLENAVFRPGPSSAFLAFDGKRVGVVAGKPVFGRDDVGRDALRDEIRLHGDGGIDGDGRPVRAHGDPAHHLHPAGDIGGTHPAAHLVGGRGSRPPTRSRRSG